MFSLSLRGVALLCELSQLWEGSRQWLLSFSLGASFFFLCCPVSALQLEWGVGGNMSLGALPPPWWGQTFFECTISAMEGYIPQMFYVSWDDGTSLPCFVIALKWELSLWFSFSLLADSFSLGTVSALLDTGFSLWLSFVFYFSIVVIFSTQE